MPNATPLVASDVLARLREAGVGLGTLLGVAVSPTAVGLASGEQRWTIPGEPALEAVAAVESSLRPRWVWWNYGTASVLVGGGIRVERCWDCAAVHRLLNGGLAADPARVWAVLHDLDPAAAPHLGQLDLLGEAHDDGGDPERPVAPDGHLRAEWAAGGWARSPDRVAQWATTALAAARAQQTRVAGHHLLTAFSESAAAALCSELAADGLPLDRSEANRIIAAAAGPRPADAAQAAELRTRRDRRVLELLPAEYGDTDLRNPVALRSVLNGMGFDVPDTRSWRLEPFRDSSPSIDALLTWRKAERIATTYGYAWLDTHVGNDGRLRGTWTESDGAAGRMTAQAGLHNLPAELRPAVRADDGHLLVRADLGQIEPRVLAVLSGDAALARATQDEDLYAPVAVRLGVERSVAKVAVLAAMYGQTSGAAGRTLDSMRRSYPAAIAYLDDAAAAGRNGQDVTTVGGRRVRMPRPPTGLDEDAERSWRAGVGRFARNATVQGAAAEFFKMWAVSVRAGLAGSEAGIVLCLHDELLVHALAERTDQVIDMMRSALTDTARRWQDGRTTVRFVAEIAAADTWAAAKI